ncbi:hypothetical protein QFW96_25580 [Saccharopolyspora sp. TS4A08]|uniref:Uncharacterized protein n=1 Tax=Saccharopolyspora ipomoeae TaxID=3042027 RepID=A0ABT6PVI1_9PSEU|nr:hypothetical protein [Saccharopolyspora sp. TS4A08]MDI2032019.1 hypothetical protein [Saccharopolyspora sp. TS4A08]
MSTSDGSPDQVAAEAEKQLRRFRDRNLRIGPGRKVHRVKVTSESGVHQPTTVCGQLISRGPLFECEAVELRADCRKCRKLCNTADPCSDVEFAEDEDGQLALFDPVTKP